MSNIVSLFEVDIPCKITLDAEGEYSYTYYRTDPTKNDGWDNCNPLRTFFSMEERKRIKNTLQKQGWYTKILDMEVGDNYVVNVVICHKDEWYRSEEK